MKDSQTFTLDWRSDMMDDVVQTQVINKAMTSDDA